MKKIIKPFYIYTRHLFYRFLLLVKGVKIMEFNDNYFNDKRVIVIGPAESALSYLSGVEIDEFDVIVRVNKSHLELNKHTEELGSRTDILIHCCDPDPVSGCSWPNEEKLIEQQNKYVIYPYNIFKIRYQFYKCLLKFRKIRMRSLNPKYYNEILETYPAKHPTTGYQTLNYLLQQNFSELHITGFTFLKTPYIQGYREGFEQPKEINTLVKKAGNHDPEAEFRLFKNMIKNKQNVFLDQTLNKLCFIDR